MQYLLLIYASEAELAKVTHEDRSAIYQEYGRLTEDLKAKGQHRAGQELQPTSVATTVRVRDGKRLVTDGPFAETKEQLGGFYMVEAADLDEALEIAGRIPTARDGSIEVRPVAAH